MRREPRRSKGHTDNSRSAQKAALAATGLSTGHSAQATEQAAAIAAARRRQHWPQQASALATARRPQLQEAGIGFHSIQYDWKIDTVNRVHSLNSITYSLRHYNFIIPVMRVPPTASLITRINNKYKLRSGSIDSHELNIFNSLHFSNNVQLNCTH